MVTALARTADKRAGGVWFSVPGYMWWEGKGRGEGKAVCVAQAGCRSGKGEPVWRVLINVSKTFARFAVEKWP